MTDLYRMLDAPDANKAAIRCTLAEAERFNTPELGFGIFVMVNSFAGARRKENLTRINSWVIDLDDGTKAQMHVKVQRSPLIPSLIVETKRGYQVYWDAEDGKPEHWNMLMLERVVPFFGADKNARDLCRILRAPGFLHLKDAADPFRCEAVYRSRVRYREQDFAKAFPWVRDEKAAQEATQTARREYAKATGTITGESFWDAVYNLDCRDGLERLSGSGAVNGESYTFRSCSNGNLNILVDGKGTSCWIDTSGRIGSMSNGGPTLYQWLRWYRVPERECVEVLKRLFPHLADIDEAARKAWRAA